jgi:hypothetical protein
VIAAEPVQANPFPRKTVVTDTLDRIPIYESVAFKAAETKLLEAAHRFGTEQNWQGGAIGLRGRFGSGKTHTCLQLVRSFGRRLSMGKAIYTRVGTANRLDLYRNYIGQNFRSEDFQRLISAHILVALRTERTTNGDKTLPDVAEKELRDRLASEPSVGIEFVRGDLLPATDLLQSLQRDVEESTRALAGDFSTAYSRIAHPLLGKLAVQWLQGNRLTLGEMRDLGVTLPGIEKPEQAWLTLRFLLQALRRAEMPFLLCMDEHERISTRSSDEDRKASWGLFKDLAEVFVGTGHLLIVSGVSDAWDSMPEDVYARIRRQDIVEIALDRSEAPKLLRAYAPKLERIFSPQALDRLYDVSQNNARRLLDLAHEAYEVWQADKRRPLEPAAIRDVTRSALGDRSRKAGLADAIEACASAMTLTVERDANFRGVFFDFVLSSTERRRILVQVSESAFLLDEIDHGREIIEAQKQLEEEHDRIRTCAVMIGYSSLEVRDALEKVVDRVLVYNEATFRTEFPDFVARALADMSLEHPPVPVPQIKDARRILDSTEAARSIRLERVQTALDEAVAPQQQRQEGLLTKQADEQMALALSEMEGYLLQESEHLIRLTRERVPEPTEATVRGVGFINAQREGLRRTRNLCEREGVGPLLAGLLEAYRNDMAKAEDAWQQLLRDTGSSEPLFAAQIRDSVAHRRGLLHDIEGRWVGRKRGTLLRWANPAIVGPMAVAILIFAWLGVGYRSELNAQQQALDALRKALNGLIEFTLSYQDSGYSGKDFVSRAVPVETALLNPAMPRGALRTDLHGAIDLVREGYRPDYQGQPHQPSSQAVNSLREVASNALESTYRPQNSLQEYVSLHVVPIAVAGILILWSIMWAYLRPWWRRKRAKQ